MTRKRKFLRDILTGEKKGRGVSSSLVNGLSSVILKTETDICKCYAKLVKRKDDQQFIASVDITEKTRLFFKFYFYNNYKNKSPDNYAS